MPIKIEQDYPLDKLEMSEENPRQIKKGKFAELRKSLKELPEMLEVREIVVDENDRVLAGHQRIRAMQANGRRTATVKRLIGWSDEKKREFMIKDNVHSGEWDSDIMANAWDTNTLEDWGVKVPEVHAHEYYGDAREQTNNQMNLNDVRNAVLTGKWGMPSLPRQGYIPERLLGFNYVLSATEYDAGVHFFIDDYQFERLWKTPHKYMMKLSPFDCCLTPDFSLYLDMPVAMQMWNVYRSRVIGKIMRDYGITVIPTLQWADEQSFEFCFDGLEQGGTVAVSTIGVKRNKDDALNIWAKGMEEAERRLKPDMVLVYGGDIGYKFKSPAKYFESENFKHGSGD